LASGPVRPLFSAQGPAAPRPFPLPGPLSVWVALAAGLSPGCFGSLLGRGGHGALRWSARGRGRLGKNFRVLRGRDRCLLDLPNAASAWLGASANRGTAVVTSAPLGGELCAVLPVVGRLLYSWPHGPIRGGLLVHMGLRGFLISGSAFWSYGCFCWPLHGHRGATFWKPFGTSSAVCKTAPSPSPSRVHGCGVRQGCARDPWSGRSLNQRLTPLSEGRGATGVRG
jgi:hypothetical protein